MRVPLTLMAAAAVLLLFALAFAAHACSEASGERERAEARLSLAEAERKRADDAAADSVERLAAVTRESIDQEARARKLQAGAIQAREAAEQRMAEARSETERLRKQLEDGRHEVESLPPTEVAERLSAAYPGGVAPANGTLNGTVAISATVDGARAILADLQERVDLKAISASQSAEIKSCGTALESSRAAGLGYLQELDAVRRRYDAQAVALDHTEASRVACQAEVSALRAQRPPSRWRRYLVAFGAGAAAAMVIAR